MDLNPQRVIGNYFHVFILHIIPQNVVTINLSLLLSFVTDGQQKCIGFVNLIEGSAKPINIMIMIQQARCYSRLPLMGLPSPICLQTDITQS